ncbi:ribonuclease [Aeromicrobium panaciterrae]|uniref:ribonuclease domain-containing protein n=1 Tax=Aeromicrobium panaciterrae TaxID=363861 RepID=UPI0031DABE1A
MKSRLIAVALIIVLAVIMFKQYDGGDESPARNPSATAATGDLPPEALDTIELIQSDGPFPYRQDGVVFQNREHRLPNHERGYWREYTVPTPGESDRGARRIIHGRGDEYYYTDDHYESFTLLDVAALVSR